MTPILHLLYNKITLTTYPYKTLVISLPLSIRFQAIVGHSVRHTSIDEAHTIQR